MPGLFGGAEDAPDADALAAATYRRAFHDEIRPSVDVPLGLVHHDDRDPDGHTVVDDGSVAGIVYGVVSNKDIEFTASLVRRILDAPSDVLPRLDGPFALACVERRTDRVVIATDKVATRPLYYTTENPFTFGSELSAVLEAVDDPTLDEQAVSDLLLMTHVWGDKTLVREVKSLRPASYVEYRDGDWEERRYWSFSFEPPGGDVVTDLAEAYQVAVEAITETISGPSGLWLSGGLDSRMFAAALSSAGESFRAYTYNRPLGSGAGPFSDDIEVARSVAETLGVEHEVLSLTSENVVDRVPELVEISDGLVGWNTMINLSAVFDVDPADVGVMCEGSGSAILCGEHVWSTRLGGSSYPGDVLYDMHARRNEAQVKRLLNADVEPKDTFIDEVRASPHSERDSRILGVTHMNYTPRKHFLSNKIARARVGTREQLPNARLLDVAGRIPPEYRTEPFPFTGGRVPHVPSPMKLKLMRTLGEGLGLLDIPYEGTQLPPSYPYTVHGVGFVVKNVFQRGLASSTIGEWYRDDASFRAYLDELIESAARRPLFQQDAVTEIRREHLRGDTDRLGLIAQITTVELFVQQLLDR